VRVVIVGAGIIGCAIAHELARRGQEVTLLDPRAEAEGATHASGGMLVPYVEAHESGPMLELGIRSLAMYDDFVAAVSNSDHRIEYRRAGSLQIAFTEEGAGPLRAAASRLAREGVDAEWMDAVGLRLLEAGVSADASGGLFVRRHGLVGAAALTRALWRAAARHGARKQMEGVTSIRHTGGKVVVNTAGGVVEAEAAIVAGGAWSAQIDVHGDPPVPVRPIRGQLVVLTWPVSPPQRILWGPRCYLVPWENGTVLVGATAEDVGFDERTTVAGVHDLLNAAAETAPDAWRAEFLGARTGLRPATPDGLPVIGPSSAAPGVFYATGHFRNGVLLAPITARLIADLVLDGRHDPALHAFSPARFGGYDGKAHTG
jgi:glycine oxidase